jgi:hypothetical protein
MANSYTINNSRGQQVVVLYDGTADGPDVNSPNNNTSLNLIGRNYPNYGLIQNENFVKILENFAQTTSNPPSKPITGQLWYDTTLNRLKVYNGSDFKLVTGSAFTSSTTAPSGASTGDQWWDTANDQFKSYNGSAWVTVGPAYSKLNGFGGAIPSLDGAHPILKMYANGNLIAIFSWDSAFTFTPITGFTTSDAKLYPGLNLNASNSGIFNGQATDSQKLNSISASSYARKDITETFAANINLGGSSAGLITSASSGTGDMAIRNAVLNADLSLYVNVGAVTTRALRIYGSTGEVQLGASPSTTYGAATKGYVDTAISSLSSTYAPINSPTLTGTPLLASTPATGDNSTKIATTAFTKAAITAATDSKWQSSAKYVRSTIPTGTEASAAAVGDFWFQV